MKKFIIILIVVIAATITINAQIPNSGFENWTTVGGYQDPTYWGSTNSYSTGSFYAITKSTEHYPATVGSYSVRMENKTSILDYSGRGALFTGPPPPGPDFSITGHPTSLTGYYKFAPQNGDTMYIFIQLYYNGSTVADAEFKSTAPASNWTSFNLPIPTYTNADKASIILAAYYANGFNYVPHGNSVLYVDNLNFDVLVESVPEQISANTAPRLFPNPATDIVNLNIENSNNENLTLNVYNTIGALVKSETLKQNQQEINVGDLNNGIYMFEIKSDEWVEKQKLIIQK